jgi:hypothetical protein
MSFQAQLVMVAWFPIILLLFNQFPPRTAIVISFIGGLLFLPQGAGFKFPLIPDYTGAVATCYGIIVAILIFDSQRITRFRFNWVDIPMLTWCLCPIVSSLTNGMGWYDAINEMLNRTAAWGLPYYLGRLYFSNLIGLKELAIYIVKGGILYIPLCLYEARMSPQLHNLIYGYFGHATGISQAIRFGGWRPIVFMEHGLVVALWMMTATIIAIWLWKANLLQTIWDIPFVWLVAALTITFLILKSTGAYLYLAYGLVIMFIAKWTKISLPLLLLIGVICLYLYINVSGLFDGDGIVSLVTQYFGTDRAQSLEFRFDNEKLLTAKAQQKLLFGWAGWGRSRIYEETWEGEIVDVSVTDSLWIISFGINGLLGLISLTASMLFPVISFAWFGYPVKTWFNPKVAPAAVLAVVLTLYMFNCLLNGHFLPIYPMISGGLTGLILDRQSKSSVNASMQSSKVKLRQPTKKRKQRRLVPR